MATYSDEVYKLLDVLGEKPVAYQRIFAKITGSVTAGVLFAQIRYWLKIMQYKEFYKTDKDFCEELGMGIYEFRSAKKRLLNLGLITTVRRGTPGKTFYNVDLEKTVMLCTVNTQLYTVERPECNTENTSENKKDIKERYPPSCNFLQTYPKKKQNGILDVFDYWNSYKGEKRWHSHNKLTINIAKAISDNLKNYSVEEMCGAIENYASVLINEEFFWEHTWNIECFFTVTNRKKEGKPKKWKQFLAEVFKEEIYVKWGKDEFVELIEDPDPELTEEIIQKYCRLINTPPGKYEVTPARKNNFIKTTIKMLDFFAEGKGRIMRAVWVEYLMECMHDNFVNKGQVCDPGNLHGRRVWDTLMRQHLSGLGIWNR